MLTSSSSKSELLINGTLRLCECVRITLTSGAVIRFTNHSNQLQIDGQTYSASGSTEINAEELEEGLESDTHDAEGGLESALIKHADLKAGRYNGATVEQFIVDWKYPWKKKLNYRKFVFEEVFWDGEMWRASISGALYKLTETLGSNLTRECRFDLFDSRCGLDISDYLEAGAVASITTQRREFTCTSFDLGDGWFDRGFIQWSSGQNAGQRSYVKTYVEEGATAHIVLELPSKFDIAVSNVFSIVPWCNKIKEGDCTLKYQNQKRHGGFPDLLGTTELSVGPDVKTPG